MVTRCISAKQEPILPPEQKWGMTMILEPKMVDRYMNIYGKINSGEIYAEQPAPILLYKTYWIVL
jgi:hypothetical protein